MTLVVEFWAKIRRLASSDSQIEKYPVGFFILGLHKQEHSFFRSKNTNLRLEIEPHRKQLDSRQKKTRFTTKVSRIVFFFVR